MLLEHSGTFIFPLEWAFPTTPLTLGSAILCGGTCTVCSGSLSCIPRPGGLTVTPAPHQPPQKGSGPTVPAENHSPGEERDSLRV